MKKIMIVVLLFASLISFSCLTDYNTNTTFHIINHSAQKIAIVPANPVIGSGNKFDSVILLPDSVYKMHFSEPGGVGFPLENLNSVSVYFNDSILFMNYRDSVNVLPSGNFLKLKDWSGGKIDEYNFDYQYIFTEADYLKAIE